MKSRAEGKVDAELESKWGFLKNIINIDVFFAGPTAATKTEPKAAESADEVEDSSTRDTRPGEKIKPLSTWKPAKKPVNGDDLEDGLLDDALEDGKVVTDSDGNIWKKKDLEVKRLKKKYDD